MKIEIVDMIIGWILYLIGFLILFKLINSGEIAVGFIIFAMGMLFLGRSTK